jgi:hypothetical protein
LQWATALIADDAAQQRTSCGTIERASALVRTSPVVAAMEVFS